MKNYSIGPKCKHANTVNFAHTFHCELLITLAVELEGQDGQGLSHLVDSKIFFYVSDETQQADIANILIPTHLTFGDTCSIDFPSLNIALNFVESQLALFTVNQSALSDLSLK